MKQMAAIIVVLLGGCTTADQLLLSQSEDFVDSVVPVLLAQYEDPAPTPRTPQQIANVTAAVNEHRAALARYRAVQP